MKSKRSEGRTKVNRREFLQLAAGGVAFPYVVRSSALGKAGTVSPSERITMAAIGNGARCKHVMQHFMIFGDVQFLAVCDARKDRREAAKGIVDTKYENKDCAAYNDIPEAVLSRPGVSVFSLRSGEDLKPFPETAPSEQYDRFVDAFTAYLSASMSMPIEVLLMRFGENYSASRAALILFWRVGQIWQAELAADFLNPIYESWLGLEIAMGRVQCPGWNDPIMRSAWLCNNWIGAPMPDIDPLRHAKAAKEQISVGSTDLDRLARNTNGSDGSSNRAKLARQLTELPPMPWDKTGKGE